MSVPTPTHSAANRWFVAELVTQWADALAFNPTDLFMDLLEMATAFPDPVQHRLALTETLHQLSVIAHKQLGQPMVGTLAGWRRHAYQSDRKSRGVHADLRIVYRVNGNGQLQLLGLGHRRIPDDVYAKLRTRATSR